jgi:hypothetical protein
MSSTELLRRSREAFMAGDRAQVNLAATAESGELCVRIVRKVRVALRTLRQRAPPKANGVPR